MAVLTGWLARPFVAVAMARGTLFPWVPLFMGLGIWGWFSLPWEPGAPVYIGAAAVLALAAGVRMLAPEVLHPWAIALGAVAVGVLACGLRVQAVQAPMLEFRYYGPVTGRVVWIDRSQTDALRITLDRVQLDRVAPARLPEKVRIALRSKTPGHAPFPGEVVMTTAHLAAPNGPVEPGSFDFRRMAFFDGLGAVGYTTAPIVLWSAPEPGARPVDQMRSALANAMRDAMPSQAGAYAAGAMTGDRSGITEETVKALRDSSLAHLLAISGMNLAFLIAFVFGLFRYGLALIPYVALRVNSKKVAALASLGVAAFYLALSGANVATERAFIMVAVMLGAVLLDRKALTLRSVAIAGVILLAWKPESLMEPGFQMSFAATVALIAGFREVDRRVVAGRLPRWAMPLFTLLLSSVIGGLATAPYAAATFNRYADYGLIANLLTVPVMGSVVMPAGAMAALLAPFGLAAPALWVMERGSAWILWVAHWVAGWDGSVTAIPAPGPWVIPLITLAGAWVILWRGWVRAVSLGPAVLALALWVGVERPLVLISSDGGLVGVLGPEGRALSAPRGAGFAAQNWLANDGDLAAQEAAAARPGMSGDAGARQFQAGGVTGVALKGKGAADRLAAACAQADLVVISVPVDQPPAGCVVLDEALLSRAGGLALYPEGQGLRVVATSATRRVWSSPRRAEDLVAVIRPRAPQGAVAARQ
ncbi:ComEC/Rec2 family competence protein [Pseudotabrizicola formosa]|uniref:ComEC/Rec2 family competence protein n=1 Tax=Pseudotabrizicola formosa TaxID=2030009 RepID=UPI001FEFBF6E|nr:ComEC/Rec2 family competence protein [Pseudotabrizicola formosa]